MGDSRNPVEVTSSPDYMIKHTGYISHPQVLTVLQLGFEKEVTVMALFGFMQGRHPLELAVKTEGKNYL